MPIPEDVTVTSVTAGYGELCKTAAFRISILLYHVACRLMANPMLSLHRLRRNEAAAVGDEATGGASRKRSAPEPQLASQTTSTAASVTSYSASGLAADSSAASQRNGISGRAREVSQ